VDSPLYEVIEMKYSILLIIGIIAVAGCTTMATDKPMESADSSASYMDISAMAAKELIEQKPDLVIIDVSPYFDQGHIPGAVNYPVGDGTLERAILSLDLTSEYLVYCHGDAPAMAGAQKLIDAGAAKVYRLEGNYKAWVDAGYPIER
jgi:rhodanese-related sulfurtransferase